MHKHLRQQRLEDVYNWLAWFKYNKRKHTDVEEFELPLVEGLLYIFAVLEAVKRLRKSLQDWRPEKEDLERKLCTLFKRCITFEGTQRYPDLTKTQKLAAGCPMTLGKILDIFEELSRLDHLIRWSKGSKGNYDLDYAREHYAWTSKRAQARRNNTVLFPTAFLYAPWRVLEMISSSPIVFFLGVPLFGNDGVHGEQRLSWCAMHDWSHHAINFKNSESFALFDTEVHHLLMKIVSVAVKEPEAFLRDLIFYIAHEKTSSWMRRVMIWNNKIDENLFQALIEARLITERLSLLLEIATKDSSFAINFDRVEEVNSVGKKSLKEILSPISFLLRKSTKS